MSIGNVETEHPEYRRRKSAYLQMRDTLAGSVEVKARNTIYLPMPSAYAASTDFPESSVSTRTWTGHGFGNDDYSDTVRHDYHPNPAYRAYLKRALFPDITAFTLEGLLGIAATNVPQVTVSSDFDYLMEDATMDGRGLIELYFDTLIEVLSYGRTSLTLDIDSNGQIKFVPYDALSFINWKGGKVNGRKAPIQAVFKERTFRSSDDAERFAPKSESEYRVLEIDAETGFYFSELYREGHDTEVVVPEYQGRQLDYIPMVTIGSQSLDLTPDKIPLMGISDIALSMYQKSADMSNSQFMSCNPMLTLIGAEADEAPKAVGSNVALILSDPNAKAQYTEPGARSLENVRQTLNDLRSQAAHHGAAILGSDKRGSESAEALRLRKSASTATLTMMVTNVNRAFNNLLNMAADWSGMKKPDMYVSHDFSGLPLTHQDRKQLVEEWHNGIISKEVVRHNLREAKVIPETVDDKMLDKQIEAEDPPPKPTVTGQSGPQSDESLGDDENETT